MTTTATWSYLATLKPAPLKRTEPPPAPTHELRLIMGAVECSCRKYTYLVRQPLNQQTIEAIAYNHRTHVRTHEHKK